MMWLLNTITHKLKYFEGYQPPYAVLSHRWGEDEVTFAEITEGTHERRKGWTKILSCCAKATIDGYAWIWADTCCIDKKSSAELSEAINSMFRWYRNSEICYAYLSDVSDALNLTKSLWFTRGWTLQELLAPLDVLFFDQDWTCIGSKFELRHRISKRTGIPEECMTKFTPGIEDHGDFGIAQVMSWAARRQTTRVEDRAYSLMGLFDINMPLMYGEGHKAFLRLQNEITKSSNDLSLFAWEGPSDPSFGMLAKSPDAFVRCEAYAPCYHNYSVTKHALIVETPIIYPFGGSFAMRVIKARTETDSQVLSGCVTLMGYPSDPLLEGKFFRVTSKNKSMVFLPTTSESAQSLKFDKIEITKIPIEAIK